MKELWKNILYMRKKSSNIKTMIKSPCNKKETSKINSDSNETYTIKPVGE